MFSVRRVLNVSVKYIDPFQPAHSVDMGRILLLLVEFLHIEGIGILQ